jgi:hypothetical protein
LLFPSTKFLCFSPSSNVLTRTKFRLRASCTHTANTQTSSCSQRPWKCGSFPSLAVLHYIGLPQFLSAVCVESDDKQLSFPSSNYRTAVALPAFPGCATCIWAFPSS